MNQMQKKIILDDVSEGDVNLSPQRAEWAAEHIDYKTKALLKKMRIIFCINLSSPCLNVLNKSDGIFLEMRRAGR